MALSPSHLQSVPKTALPLQAGLSLKPEHFSAAKDNLTRPENTETWFEVHPENYMVDGGPRIRELLNIRALSCLSLHGVGASLGGPQLTSDQHIRALKQLIDLFEPQSISEHAVWSHTSEHYFAELLPLPRTHEALQQLVDGVNHFQEGIGQQILIENPTNYLSIQSEMDEADFLVSAAQSTGCGLLVDINNIYLSSHNCGINAEQYIQSIPSNLVGEIHIAGFSKDPMMGGELLIDSHDHDVSDDVWSLLDLALQHFGPKPILLERDSNLPSFTELMREREIAQNALEKAELEI